MFGLYGTLDIDRRVFSRTDFLFKTVLALDEIKEIRYQSMFCVSSYDAPSLSLVFIIGRQVNLYYFSNRNFDEKTLAQLAHDLKEAAPHIKYDPPAEQLVKKDFP